MGEAADAGHGTGIAGRAQAWTPWQAGLIALAVYYAGVRIGMSLTLTPMATAVLWPPNALVMALLVLAPTRSWWAVVTGALVAHVLGEMQSGVPAELVALWFVSNMVEALMGASLIRLLTDSPSLRTVRSVMVMSCAVVSAAFVSSFVDAAFVRLVGWRSADYATLWNARFFSNVLASLTFVPLLVTWGSAGDLVASRHRTTRAALLESGALIAGLFGVSVAVFDSSLRSTPTPATMLYLPLPFLLWAALRFGPAVTSLSFAMVAYVVIWGAAQGRGPFRDAAAMQDQVGIQMFLVSMIVPLLLVSALMDERRMAERRLRASEDLFSTAFRRGPVAMAITRETDGSLVEANEQWRQLLGRAVTLRGLLDGPSRERVDMLLAWPGRRREAEVTFRDSQNAMHVADLSMASVTLGGEACHVSILRDLTLQRQAEREADEQRRQLTHLTRVASLSNFSSTIAHELNQPLTAILSNAQAAVRFLSRQPPNLDEVRAILGEIAEADKRAGQMIQHLRMLMKKGDEVFAHVDLNHLVAEVLDFVHGEFLLHGVEVRCSYASDLPLVLGDRVQLQQLLLNLVFNACEAMQGRPAGAKVLHVSTLHGADGLVRLVVADTGPGITRESLAHVFEPFYTTKSNGLGLGLAICRRIAEAHGGALSAESHPGQGTAFRFALPSAVIVRAATAAST